MSCQIATHVGKMESYISGVSCAKFFFTRKALGVGVACITHNGRDIIKTIVKVATKTHG